MSTALPGLRGHSVAELTNPDGTVRIPLAQGGFATVDPGDVETVAKYCWRALRRQTTTYASRSVSLEYGSSGTVLMHRMLLDAPASLRVDHWDHDGLNNRRFNIRHCTPSQNGGNIGVVRSKTGFKGVSTKRDRFRANIRCEGKLHYLGTFKSAEEAARAYDAAALAAFGQFACLNFSPMSSCGGSRAMLPTDGPDLAGCALGIAIDRPVSRKSGPHERPFSPGNDPTDIPPMSDEESPAFGNNPNGPNDPPNIGNIPFADEERLVFWAIREFAKDLR